MARTQFFYSGISTIDKLLEERGVSDFNELISYWECRKWPTERIVNLAKRRKRLMIDSGAYSAYTQKKTIDLEEFTNWSINIHEELKGVTNAIHIGLDVLGDWKESQKNQTAHDATGITFIATFHRPDPPEYLDWILNRECSHKYMGIGGLVTDVMDTSKLIPFLDFVYDKICDEEGKPRIETHLFGIGDTTIINRYPATTSDSTSILWPSIYGNIMLPQLNPYTGKPDYSQTLLKISISSENEKQRQANAHFRTLKAGMRDHVANQIEKAGFTVAQLETDGTQRTLFNFLQFKAVTEHWPENTRFKRTHTEDILGF